MGSLWKDSATIDHARNTWASEDVVTGVALNPPHDIHPLDTLAENNVTSIAPRTGVGGDEELSQEGRGEWLVGQRNTGWRVLGKSWC